MPRVLVTHPLLGPHAERSFKDCDLEVWEGPGLLHAGELRARLQGCDGLLCLLTDRIDADLLAARPELRCVSSVSVGVDHIDLEAATARGVAVGHTPGVLVDATADTAFALLLAAARRVAEADRFVRAGRWSAETPWSPDFFVGKEVAGATLGIVGLGAIGQAVARRATGFAMRLLAWNRSERQLGGVEFMELDDLLAESDFVSIHVALTEATRGLIDARRIALMRDDAVLVNTARGGIVDEVALAGALNTGRLAAAGIDVFEDEPIKADSPLLNVSNVVLTPHIGSATARTRRRMVELAIGNLQAALAGQRMRCCANPQVYDD